MLIAHPVYQGKVVGLILSLPVLNSDELLKDNSNLGCEDAAGPQKRTDILKSVLRNWIRADRATYRSIFARPNL
jgi:hypothetical protein